MSKQSELNSYISQLHNRLRLHIWLSGSALLVFTALATTVVLVFLLNHFAFPATGIRGARLVLILGLLLVAALGIILPLWRLTTTRTVRKVEATHPDLEQRLTTFHERQQGNNDPFLELLAAETLQHTQNAPTASIVPNKMLFSFVGIGLGCLATLIWLVTARPGFVGYGASILWTGEHKDTPPLYSITVTPGDATVRRNSDQLITVHISGLRPDKVQLFAQYQSTKAWESMTMQPQSGLDATSNYQFTLAGLPENVEYYVSAGPLKSQHYKVRVVDLPSVKSVKVTYRYPGWTGMKPATQEQSGDLRAMEGTTAQVDIHTDKPLSRGTFALDDGHEIALSAEGGNTYTGIIHMTRDGAYHLAAVDQGQPVRLSEDYFIATEKAEPPQVSISRPGGDYRASPIEEVTIGVQGSDSFGLRDLRLHYSVNGGPDREVNMLPARGAKNVEGSHTLQLEPYKLVPGDLISLYATAKDGHAEARTNISFVQIDPFEREFSQSQQSGGGGAGAGGQNNQMEISRREKELIAATWKQQTDKTSLAKDGQFLSDAQTKLRDQVLALSSRMQSRDLGDTNEEFTDFEKNMRQAADAMAPAADHLKGMQWKNALPLEQRALQALLRAEATFRKIQVAFGQQGGGAGGADSAGRDLASLFDLEMDTEKNQYETAQSTSPSEKQQKDIEDILARLDALARRQQELTAQQRNPQQSFQERWQQEMLRREAEQLQRQMEQQLAQNNQKNGAQQGSQQANSSSSSRSSSSATSSSSSSDTQAQQNQRMQQALNRLRQATESMKRNAERQTSADAARQATERLQAAKDLLSSTEQQLASGKLGTLSREADRITQEERTQSDRIQRFASQPAVDLANRESMQGRMQQRNQLAADRQQLSDDLSTLQRNIRDSARAMASNQPQAAQKLRQALTEMDDADLDNYMQRTADWLRRGINPASSGTESEIAKGLQKLSQRLQQAQQEANTKSPANNPASRTGDQLAALEQLRRMRRQLDGSSTRSPNTSKSQNDPGQQGRNSPQGQRDTATLNRQTQSGSSGSQMQNSRSQSATNNGEVRQNGGGSADGTAWGNINTGDNTYASGGMFPAPTDASGNPQDTEKALQQQLREFRQLGRTLQADPNLSKEIRDLTRRMQNLDPKRFPGNPALVDQMREEMLGSIDRIELQLLNQESSTEARSGRSSEIPSGYQNAVADYYRRLSQYPQTNPR